MGGRAPGKGRPPALREHGRARLSPVVLRSGRGRLELGGLGGHAAPLGRHWTAANAPEEGGTLGSGHTAVRRQWRARTARCGGEERCTSQPGAGAPFKATCRPPSDRQTGGGHLGNARLTGAT
jgi:hypothetical protein